jgi:transposase
MDEEIPDPGVPERAKRPRSYPARYKAEILAEYERLDRDGKGRVLHREGLYTSLISEWRKQRDRGALQALGKQSGRPPVDPVEREAARLRRENQRLAAELDKPKKVIELQGSSRRCWSSSPPTAARGRAASRSDRPGRRGAGPDRWGQGGLPSGRAAPRQPLPRAPQAPTATQARAGASPQPDQATNPADQLSLLAWDLGLLVEQGPRSRRPGGPVPVEGERGP